MLFQQEVLSIGIDIKFDIWLNIICSRCFIDIFWQEILWFVFGSIWFSRLLLTHVLFLTWSACFGSIVFICYVVSTGSSSQFVLILSLIFGWTLSVKDVSLISFSRKFCNFCFWINLVFEIAFDTCSVFDLICLFWVNSVYLLCCYSRKFFSIAFDIWLNIIC